jgi:Putative auto-transporter adhesin, head GIN domain
MKLISKLTAAALGGVAAIALIGVSLAGPTGPVDQTFNVRNVHIDGLVAQVDLVAIPQGPVRVQATGPVKLLKDFHVRAVGDEVLIRLDTHADEAWFPWNLFNRYSRERKANDLKIRISAPLGTPYDIEDMIGSITAGDLDAPLRLDGSALKVKIGRVQSAKVSIGGSGSVSLGAIKERLSLEIGGGGDFQAASAASAEISIGGGGEAVIGDLKEGLDIEVGGSGDIRVASVNGPVEIDIGGSGDVRIGGGRATPFSVAIGGSGDVDFKGHAENPSIAIAGSGNVRVGSYSGRLEKEIVGSGDFEVTNPGAQPQAPTPPAPPAKP